MKQKQQLILFLVVCCVMTIPLLIGGVYWFFIRDDSDVNGSSSSDVNGSSSSDNSSTETGRDTPMTIIYPENPSIGNINVIDNEITLTISTNHHGSSYPDPRGIILYWNNGGSFWEYMNISLNSIDQYTFSADHYNTTYTFYVETAYYGYSDGKSNINKQSTQVSAHTDPIS